MFLKYIPLPPTFRGINVKNVVNVINVINVVNVMNVMKIKEIFEAKPLEKPLGRWCLCGNKNSKGIDALEWKELQKHKRQKMLEKKQDPFEIYSTPDNVFYEKQREEEYMIPFVFDL